MLRALDRDPHALRLRDLLTHYRTEEQSMTAVLRDLQHRLENSHRDAGPDGLDEARWIDDDELREDFDQLATELVHVRMAIAGTRDELTEHEGQPRLTTSLQRLGA